MSKRRQAYATVPTEHEEQVRLMQWWAWACKSFGLPEHCLFAIPNGGARHIAVASKLKAEGVRAGIPDLFLAVPTSSYCGLFIELKKCKGGVVSKPQKESMQMLREQRYVAVVARGWEEAKRVIEGYLG